MKKMILMLLILTAVGVKSASAQNGINNLSDYGVPVMGSINLNTPFIRVIIPPLPPMPAMPGLPAVSPTATLPSGGLMPAVPRTPLVPVGPDANVLGNNTTAQGGIVSKFPALPILPPVPAIPPLPQVRLRVN